MTGCTASPGATRSKNVTAGPSEGPFWPARAAFQLWYTTGTVFNLGFGELAVIFIVLIIAVGPDRLPAMMKGLGKTIRTVRQASRDIRATVGIDEMLREDVLQPLPRRPVPKAAIARPPAASATLPAPTATPTQDAPPIENARPPAETGPVPPPAEATAAPQVTAEPAPVAAPAPATPADEAPVSATPVESPGKPAPRKD